MKEERIQKIIARAGLASRRSAEQFLVDKRVRVNGKRVAWVTARIRLRIELKSKASVSSSPNLWSISQCISQQTWFAR